MNISNNSILFSQEQYVSNKRIILSKLLALILSLFCLQTVKASELDYKLVAEPVGEGTYVFIGSTKYFSKKNGGNIANTAYIVTNSGVIVIDTGSSYKYGKQMREYIESTTGLSIIKVFITHHHPDHFLGNQAYQDVPIASLSGVIDGISAQGGAFTDNLYALLGDWMKETDVYVPTEVIEPGKVTIGGHEIEIIALNGHTDSDMVIYDRTTGVLFAGDLIFHNRTPAAAHANIENWLNSISQLQELDYKYLIAGHGPVTTDKRAMVQTRDYLSWLHETIESAIEGGLDMSEALQIELPQSFQALDILHEEYKRAVLQLYPSMEQAYFN
jgi:quinoprotein relay system zinc metallohydrolase 1